MPEPTLLLGFIAASLVLLIIPGPGVLYVIARTLTQGRRAGLMSVLGLSTGALVHVVAATAGLSALLAASATAFAIVKVLGAAYLVYLGVRAIISTDAAAAVGVPPARSARRVFADGVVVSVLNPKLAVFFLAFLPQFVDPDGLPAPLQVLLLGLLYVLLAVLSDGTYAMLASELKCWLKRPLLRGPLPRYASGAVYIGMGIGTALFERDNDR